MSINISSSLVGRPGGVEVLSCEKIVGDVYASSKKARGTEISTVTFMKPEDLKWFYLFVKDILDRDFLDNEKTRLIIEQNALDGNQLYLDGIPFDKKKIIFSRTILASGQPQIALT